MGALSDWLHGIEHEVESIFSDAEKTALSFFKALIDGVATAGPKLLGDAAMAAVTAAETAGGSGAEKLSSAQAAVLNTLSGQGVSVATNIVNGAIEAAVATLRANAPVVPAAVSTVTSGASDSGAQQGKAAPAPAEPPSPAS